MYEQQQGRVYTRPESKALWLEYRGPDGVKIRRSARTTVQAEAEAELKRLISQVGALTFQEAVVDFFEVKSRPGQLRPKTIQNYQTSLRAVAPLLGDLTLNDIDRDVLKEFVRSRRKTVSDTSVRRDLAFVSTVFTHAIETLPQAPVHNPLLSFTKRHLKEKVRTRWLRPQEYQLLRRHCTNDNQRLILETAVLTGMRHGELTALRKGMINFEKNEVTLDVDMTKSGKERIIPLCESLCLKLEQLCLETPGDLVFCHFHATDRIWKPYLTFANFWKSLRLRAGLEDVRFHDLRHTFASWWVQAGGDLLRLKDVLGHSSLQMVQRYAHLNTAAHHQEIKEVFGTQFGHRSE